MNKTIAIIDYELGNTRSVKNALTQLGYRSIISRRKEDLRQAHALILPGVGSFGEAMGNLERLDLLEDLNYLVLELRKPILGICLGMQILADRSEEDSRFRGLGWIEGEVVRLAPPGLRVPHVGWNHLAIHHGEPLFTRNEPESHYYFDHSFHYSCSPEHVAATCVYGTEVVAAVQKDNIFGVQFHPEKSHKSGLKLFRSFFSSHLI